MCEPRRCFPLVDRLSSVGSDGVGTCVSDGVVGCVFDCSSDSSPSGLGTSTRTEIFSTLYYVHSRHVGVGCFAISGDPLVLVLLVLVRPHSALRRDVKVRCYNFRPFIGLLYKQLSTCARSLPPEHVVCMYVACLAKGYQHLCKAEIHRSTVDHCVHLQIRVLTRRTSKSTCRHSNKYGKYGRDTCDESL